MDGSRAKDLDMFRERMEDVTLPMSKRRQAANHFFLIRAQIKDRKLAELRHRLIKATRANDLEYIEKFEGQIKQHSYRMGYDRYENPSY